MSTDVQPAILLEGVSKRYRGRGAVLDGLDLVVGPGTVHGLLGPNGAGKTTTVRILTTLLRFDAGSAWVAGRDVVKDPIGVRARIGVAGQFTTVDELLSGRENLELFARLHHLPPKTARLRATDLLERFDLAPAADRPVRGYSGGMRRRLDLAVSLIRNPQVLFLDEPTTGLDPRSRLEVWNSVRELASSGTTVLLTTQYLEEADRLCQRISMIDHGRVVAEGCSAELKLYVGRTRAEISVPEGRDLLGAAHRVAMNVGSMPELDADARTLSVAMNGEAQILEQLAGALRELGLTTEELALRRPDLDDVFLHVTGRTTQGQRER
ncbi:ATP-binding cassette domain-containing protein [Aeromicrobium phragmitis]|uniref:ATP-binding cassette domain-containing protein n=1 Tax=Aeromicrobium phragmitis TaxID=2478914 RepID=A0A3L8PLU1_9ACTN|nr:ATP-binding cassette domain-containing protein [Aeromicrobium phragmitis]RLV55779.1 ATP-binding cassette domain-containing protein [Aeromicrobium phragmitis]